MKSLLRNPTASLPIVMSLAAMALVLGYVGMFGVGHETDEGTPAHIWQILMVAQLPLILYFAVNWVPRERGQALKVLGLQACAAMAAMAPVFWFNL